MKNMDWLVRAVRHSSSVCTFGMYLITRECELKTKAKCKASDDEGDAKKKQKAPEDLWAPLKKQSEDLTGTIKKLGWFGTIHSFTFIDMAFLKQKIVDKTGEILQYVYDVINKEQKDGKFFVQGDHKLIKDPIHGTISLHPLALVIMNTPQFQRLHDLKQLSIQHYVYPGAGYSRFEHSVGVYHLAGKLVNLLKDKQPELGITDIDAMCVQLAGLCHDLGHGPFSHLFEGVIKEIDSNNKWAHEDSSVEILDHIYEANEGVRNEFAKWGLYEKDLEFIKSLIKGKKDYSIRGRKQLRKTGRCPDKSFLYEIVANNTCGMDVDKWDYLVRDSFHLGIKCGFDPNWLINHLRVMKVKDGKDKNMHICVRDKEHESIYSMFHTRYELYRKAYHHKVVTALEMMLKKAIANADRLVTPEGKSLIDCLGEQKVEAYTKLNDSIFFKILDANEEEWKEYDEESKKKLKTSKDLLERIMRRDLWKCVGHAQIKSKEHGQEVGKEVKKVLSQKEKDFSFEFKVNTRNFGHKNKNPLDYIGFYSKKTPTEATLIRGKEQCTVLPTEFEHSILLIYCTSERKELQGDVLERVEEAVRDALKKRQSKDEDLKIL